MAPGVSEKVVKVILRVLYSFGIHLVFSLVLFTVAPGAAAIIVIIWIFPALYIVVAVVICAAGKRLDSLIAWILWPVFWLCLNLALTQW
ncbi:hypothetical protein [Planotetraspora sp. GP83]|uniref:hypothetical protein n=1 Tax=Planotetraspora sp. GP83 TaxID=3156264 RepID=UPI0035153FC0